MHREVQQLRECLTGGRGHGPEHPGFTMVDAEAIGGLLHRAGLTDVDASTEQIVGRSVISVTARGRDGSSSGDPP